MTLRTTVLVGLCIAAGAAGVTVAIRAARARQLAAKGRHRFDPGEAAVNAAGGPGIAPIDPQPMTQIAGEGIDLDAPTGRLPRLDEVVGPGLRR
jgi:hypothetical protein